jgi:hypothetical protein
MIGTDCEMIGTVKRQSLYRKDRAKMFDYLVDAAGYEVLAAAHRNKTTSSEIKPIRDHDSPHVVKKSI